MSLQSVTLDNLLHRMNRYQDIATVEEQYKVRDLDQAIRTQRRMIKPPWAIVKTTLRIFENVFIYAVPNDFDYLAYLDNQLQNQQSPSINGVQSAYFTYTSLEQFYEDTNNRNKLCDIWDRGTRYLGVKYWPIDASSALTSTTTLGDYSVSGDASNLFLEQVTTVDDTDSIGFTVTHSSNVALIQETMPTAISDTSYKSKYYFRWAYFYDNVPTSIQLRFGTDSSNYLYANVTTQFSGQQFMPNSWNLIAIDLNVASTNGTINDQSFAYEAIQFTGLATGTYYINNAYLRGWHLFDYYYYSKYNIKTNLATVADQQFFFVDSTNEYSGDDSLVGDSEWIDVIVYDAMLTTLGDNKNRDVITYIKGLRDESWAQLALKYPDMAPVIVSSSYNFSGDPGATGWGGGDGWGNGWGW